MMHNAIHVTLSIFSTSINFITHVIFQAYLLKVESSRTFLTSRIHFEVFGLASKLKSLASKPTSPWKCPVLGSRTALFFDSWKRKITKENLILTSVSSSMTFFFEIAQNFAISMRFLRDDLFFETTCKIVSSVFGLGLEKVGPWSWPRIFFESLAWALNVGFWTPLLINWVSSRIERLVWSNYSLLIFPTLL